MTRPLARGSKTKMREAEARPGPTAEGLRRRAGAPGPEDGVQGARLDGQVDAAQDLLARDGGGR